jgi:hypothetical protein
MTWMIHRGLIISYHGLYRIIVNCLWQSKMTVENPRSKLRFLAGKVNYGWFCSKPVWLPDGNEIQTHQFSLEFVRTTMWNHQLSTEHGERHRQNSKNNANLAPSLTIAWSPRTGCWNQWNPSGPGGFNPSETSESMCTNVKLHGFSMV